MRNYRSKAVALTIASALLCLGNECNPTQEEINLKNNITTICNNAYVDTSPVNYALDSGSSLSVRMTDNRLSISLDNGAVIMQSRVRDGKSLDQVLVRKSDGSYTKFEGDSEIKKHKDQDWYSLWTTAVADAALARKQADENAEREKYDPLKSGYEHAAKALKKFPEKPLTTSRAS